jgi:hypothetical protein
MILYDSLVAERDDAVEAVVLTVTYHWNGSGSSHIEPVRIARVGPSGTKAYVRGAYLTGDLGTTSPQVWVVRDFEAPLGVPVTYTVERVDFGTSQTTPKTITLPDEGCEDTWLTDLARPMNTQRIEIEALPELVYPVDASVHAILTRRTPIVASDVADTPTFELTFLTESDEEREKSRAILGNGVPVLLRTPPANGIGSVYFSVRGFKEQRVVKPARVTDRRFIVDCVQVDRPDPLLYLPIPPATYESVEANFATYADLNAQRDSYDAVLYDYEDTEAGNIVPWPPVDV